MEETQTNAVPDTATATPPPAQAETPKVESGQTATPETVTVSLADFRKLQEEVATLKQSQRKAQSDKDKKLADISKKFQREIEAVNTRAPREGWDADEVKTRQSDLAREYAVKRFEVEAADDTPAPSDDPFPAQGDAKPMGMATADEAKQALARTLARFDLTEKDVDLAPFLKQVTNPAEYEQVDAEFWKTVRTAYNAKQQAIAAGAKVLQSEAQAASVKQTMDTFGGLGGSHEQGTPATERTENKHSLDVNWDELYNKTYGGKS